MTTKNERPTVYVDMDNTLFDFDSAALQHIPEHIRQQYQDNPEFYVANRFPVEYQQVIRDTYAHPDFFAELEPLPGALDAWEALLDHGFEPRILSSPLSSNPRAIEGKRESLRRHFVPRFGAAVVERAIIDKAKWNYSGLTLIDDRPNAAQGHPTDWQQVLFTRPANQATEAAYRLPSWENPESILMPMLGKLLNNYRSSK